MERTTWLTATELGTRLHVSTKTLSNWRYIGKGPRYLKADGIIRYRIEDIEAFERTHLVETDGGTPT